MSLRDMAQAPDWGGGLTAYRANNALERARSVINLPMKVTAHLAKHTYCTQWVRDSGDGEIALEKLSRQVGTSVAVLRATYVHISLTDADWAHLAVFGRKDGIA